MLHLANRNVGPPGSFRYHVAALGGVAPKLAWVGPFHSFSELMREVEKRCRANGLTVPSETEVEDQLCQSLPPGHCRTEDNLPVTKSGGLAVTAAMFAQGTRTLWNWWVKGKPRVSKDEIVSRSYLCNQCPWHKPIESCSACAMKPVRELVNEVVGGTRLPTDAMLQACGVCGCSLVAKTRIPVEILLANMPESQKEQLWERCWLRKEHVNVT